MYRFSKSEDGTLGLSIRLVLFAGTVGYLVYLYNNPDLLGEIKDVSLKSHDDLINWGKDKIAFNFTNISKRTITHIKLDDDDESPNPEVAQLKRNETDYENGTNINDEDIFRDEIIKEYANEV